MSSPEIHSNLIYATWAEVCADVPTARPMVCLFDLFGLTGACSVLDRAEDTHPYNLGVHPIFRQTQQGHFPPRSHGVFQDKLSNFNGLGDLSC